MAVVLQKQISIAEHWTPLSLSMSTFKPAIILSILKNMNTQGGDCKAFKNTWNVNVSTLKGHGQLVPLSWQCTNGSLLQACK